jgi:uncharacterized membrane protein
MLAQAHSSRLVVVDALRGSAIVLMVIYHFCFDLSYFGLASFDFYEDRFWLNLRTLILSLFLGLVGVSLVLASRQRLDVGRYLRRLILLVASAALVSLSTWWMFGERFVFFGVLHFIAAASVLALLFLRAGSLNLIAGVGVILFATRYQCPGPPNLSVQRSDHNILIRWPLLYPSTENSQGLVFGGHDAQQSAATADPSSQGLAGLR